MKMDSGEIKRLVAHYLRYDLQCPILALEVASGLDTSFNDGGSADLLAMNQKRYLIEVEVKISIADFKADRKKGKHEYFRNLCELPYNNQQVRFGEILTIEPRSYPTHHFYFAVPYDLANETKLLCEEMYPYAGLLTNEEGYYGNIMVRRQPKVLSREKLTLLQATRLAKGQSATLVRLLDEVHNWKSRA